MVTTEELRAIPLFSELEDKELSYLARTVADLRLNVGEYAAHEGEAQALIVTLEGKLDATKFVDGVETVVGERGPGDLFGEVTVTLNTPLLASLRAVEKSRVIRIEPNTYHQLCVVAPQIAAKVGAAALERIEGLHDLAARPPSPEVRVVGPSLDPATHELREFLHRNQVPYEWLTPDDPDVGALQDDAGWPLVRLRDGTITTAPAMRELAKMIGLSVTPMADSYEVVIVGGGPGGLAAAVYGASEGLRTVLIEREAPGGQAGTSSRIENYLGFPVGVSGDELAHRALVQARRLGAEIVVTRCARSIQVPDLAVVLDEGETLRASAIVLALGVTWRRLDIPSIDRFIGRGVYYGASPSDAHSIHGQDIFIIGAGNSSGQAALYFAGFANSVTLLCRGDSLAKSMSHYLIEQLKTKSNINVQLRAEVTGLYGQDHLEAIDVADRARGSVALNPTTGLFAFIGADTDTQWLPTAIARDTRGFVLTGVDAQRSGKWPLERDPYLLETTVPGVFAIGDVRSGSVKRVAAGVGEGSMSIAFIHQYLADLQTAAR
ncbi:MAG: FAD-dependent oxidoreductase [Candidatus Eremiobacteraeota bacterium]|nr:FAD-dependent oxidoreductase [Candidatus Eremiobacteraeota bacterium]